MTDLGSYPVRGLCSTNRPNSMPPCGVALVFGLVEGFGVEVGKGAERHVEKSDGEENSVP